MFLYHHHQFIECFQHSQTFSQVLYSQSSPLPQVATNLLSVTTDSSAFSRISNIWNHALQQIILTHQRQILTLELFPSPDNARTLAHFNPGIIKYPLIHCYNFNMHIVLVRVLQRNRTRYYRNWFRRK